MEEQDIIKGSISDKITKAILEFNLVIKRISDTSGIDMDTVTLVLVHDNGMICTGTSLPPDAFVEVLEDTARNEREKNDLKKVTVKIGADEPPIYHGKGGTA